MRHLLTSEDQVETVTAWLESYCPQRLDRWRPLIDEAKAAIAQERSGESRPPRPTAEESIAFVQQRIDLLAAELDGFVPPEGFEWATPVTHRWVETQTALLRSTQDAVRALGVEPAPNSGDPTVVQKRKEYLAAWNARLQPYVDAVKALPVGDPIDVFTRAVSDQSKPVPQSCQEWLTFRKFTLGPAA